METSQSFSSPNKKFNLQGYESVTIKLIIIGILVLVLIIPSSWIMKLIKERQVRANSVIQEISGKWSGPQSLAGPVLVVPYTYHENIRDENGLEVVEKTSKAFFLPEKLSIDGEVSPEPLHRGIFETVVYSSILNIQAQFKTPLDNMIPEPDAKLLWSQAYLTMSITGISGISSTPDVTLDGKKLETEPSANSGYSIKNFLKEVREDNPENTSSIYTSTGITARLKDDSWENFRGQVTVRLNLKGSQALHFLPTGKETRVTLKGDWNDPSFEGEFLPEKRVINKEGFSAQWNILHYNRPFEQQWTGTDKKLSGSEFGLRMLIPVEQYQKSMRTAKYAQLIIILTFTALFLVEIIRKIRIHPFQYLLVGAALIIYYTLLVSISEHLGFAPAYWIATLATVGLVSLYATSFMADKGLVILFTTLLSVFYAFIFVIILQQDLSLLIGSIGLFILVAALMYFSRKIQWYQEKV